MPFKPFEKKSKPGKGSLPTGKDSKGSLPKPPGPFEKLAAKSASKSSKKAPKKDSLS